MLEIGDEKTFSVIIMKKFNFQILICSSHFARKVLTEIYHEYFSGCLNPQEILLSERIN